MSWQDWRFESEEELVERDRRTAEFVKSVLSPSAIQKIAINTSKRAIEIKLSDSEILRQIDLLMREVLIDTHPAWVKWGYYIESTIGKKLYETWSSGTAQTP